MAGSQSWGDYPGHRAWHTLRRTRHRVTLDSQNECSQCVLLKWRGSFGVPASPAPRARHAVRRLLGCVLPGRVRLRSRIIRRHSDRQLAIESRRGCDAGRRLGAGDLGAFYGTRQLEEQS